MKKENWRGTIVFLEFSARLLIALILVCLMLEIFPDKIEHNFFWFSVISILLIIWFLIPVIKEDVRNMK